MERSERRYRSLMPQMSVNGLSMYYDVHGQGDPLLLILGLALDVSEVGPIIDGLASRFRVIAFDN